MKKLIIILLAIIALSSCVVTQKQRDKFCGNCTQTAVTKDSVATKIKYKDTTIYVSTPPTTATVESPCDSVGKLKDFKITETKNGIKTTIEGKGNKLIVTCKADSLEQVIKGLNQEITKEHFKQETKIITKECNLEHRTGFDYFCRWFFYILAGLFVLRLILKRIPYPFKTKDKSP